MSYIEGMKETLWTAFRMAAVNLFAPEIKRSPEDEQKFIEISEAMVKQVRAGTPPAKATPPQKISVAESRALLKNTGIHRELSEEWQKYCKNANDARATCSAPENSSKNNPYLPQGWTQHLQ